MPSVTAGSHPTASARLPAVTEGMRADESLLERINELSDDEVDALLRDFTEYEG
jgi:hypothetical protein